MLINYLKVAVRNILKNKTFAFINVFGLALSMSIGLIVILFTSEILQSDRFHKHKDQIFRITTFAENEYSAYDFATCPLGLGKEVTDNFPGVIHSVTLKKTGGTLEYAGKEISGTGLFASNDFFKVFSYELHDGVADNALMDPFSIVISSQLAEKLFYPEDPIGKLVHLENKGDFIINGVIRDKNYKSHLQFDYLLSFETIPILINSGNLDETNIVAEEGEDITTLIRELEWFDYYSKYTYLLLDKSVSRENLIGFMNRASQGHYDQRKNERLTFGLQALSTINPGKAMANEIGFTTPNFILIIFFVISFIIILMAVFNYTNLTVAKSLSRAREVGMRKVVGASRIQLICQYILEAVILSLIALLLAIGIVEIIIPAIQNIDPLISTVFELQRNISIYTLFLLFSLLTGILAGLFPSLYLSAFRPVNVLKGVVKVKLFAGTSLRKILLTMQFIISILLVVSSALLFKQVYQINNTDLGFHTENRLVVYLQGMDYKLFSSEIKSNPDIKSITATSGLPVAGPWSSILAKTETMEKEIQVHDYSIGPEFIDRMGLQIIAGRNFDEKDAIGDEKNIIVNEKALETFFLGNRLEAIGKKIMVNGNPLIIIGVVKDYFIKTTIEEMEPVILRFVPQYLDNLIVHYRSDDPSHLITLVENKWKKLEPEHPFRYTFMDTEIGILNKIFNSLLGIVAFVSMLSITIACLGLLGILSFNTQTRIKEMGIRKVFGISRNSIIWLLSKDYIFIMIIAMIIALPIIWLITNQIKMLLPNTIGFDFVGVACGVLLILGLVALTIASQTLKSTRTNPIDSLRFE